MSSFFISLLYNTTTLPYFAFVVVQFVQLGHRYSNYNHLQAKLDFQISLIATRLEYPVP